MSATHSFPTDSGKECCGLLPLTDILLQQVLQEAGDDCWGAHPSQSEALHAGPLL